jgi:PAS domain S-box-containing protein
LSRRTLLAAVALALVEAGGAIAVVASSERDAPAGTAALAITAGASFVAAGLLALHRRPDNRTGLYLAAVGYLWFPGALMDSSSDALFTFGMLLGNLAFIPFAALVLAFPSGQLARRPDRRLVLATAAFVLTGPPLLMMFDGHPHDCVDCADSAIVVVDSPTTERVIGTIGTVVVVALCAFVVAVLVGRWRRATPALRRVLGPVYLAGGATLVLLLVSNVVAQFSVGTADSFAPVFLVLFAAVPFAFLLGILRSRLARGSVAALVVELGRGTPLRDAIAAALGDPALEIAYWLDDHGGYADREGRRYALPAPGSGRAATVVEQDGRRIGALVHDESLSDQPELLASVSAAVALALDNERLETELRAQYDFLMTIVETAPSLLVSVDAEGRIKNMNPATVEASGLGAEERLRDRFFWDVFIDAADRDAVIDRFHAAAPDHAPSEYENAFTNARGERRVIAWRAAPVRDETGSVVRIVAGGLDVTHRKQQEEELRASRARLVAAADDARRRLERNLHDGAQQRLVALSLALRLAQANVDSDPAAARELLAGASEELALALEELRELARGIHPAVLTDRGLRAALEGLARRAPLPVEVDLPDERLPEPIEAAAYYVVAEALTNVVKHAHASAAAVRVAVTGDAVGIEVSDDGVGVADAAAGSGLRGLADRVAALDGSLAVESPATGGTRVVAEIPLPVRAAPPPEPAHAV